MSQASAPRRTTAASLAARALRSVAGGRLAPSPLRIRFWDGSELPAADPMAPTAVVRDCAALAHLLHAPNQVGLVRAWLEGSLELDGDLEQVLPLRERYRDLRLTTADRLRLALLAAAVGGARAVRRPPPPPIEARARGRLHSLARDRSAISHHYEISNRFYELMLGPTMVYSCAYFADPSDSLEQAQTRKLETICRKLRLREGERFLDIGCGWGSLVMHAAQHHGVRAVGITLSRAQAELARERIAAAGLQGRAEVRVCDYRELRDGPYDKVASVGMYEHVGRAKLGEYVRAVRALVRPGGLFLNHGIARLRNDPGTRETFINRYIFPDGELHPVTAVMSELERADFELRDLESLREHYVLTLRRWLANLDAHAEAARAEVGAQRLRAWRLYLIGSAHAFAGADISVFQVLSARYGAPHGLPLTRRELLEAPPVEARGVRIAEVASAGARA
jgi:cyclopropane-fatty-acyl-phospholipid synthase